MLAPVRFSVVRTRGAFTLVALALLIVFVSASCRSVLSRKYEYDEDVYLALDGSATVYVNASIAALVALRNADLNVDPRARLDMATVRALYETPVTRVASATSSRRENRRYVHLRLEVSDVRRLSEAAPFGWSRYELEPRDQLLAFRQSVGAAAGRNPGDVGWDGDEFVAFRLHLPSRVVFHNSPAGVQRGNIIEWEQPLADRIKGQPLAMEVHVETESILIRTLTLFAITIGLAIATFALAIWWVMRRGRAAAPKHSDDLPIS
jgi:hypothetical protein